MSDTEQLLDKAVLLGLLVDQYSDQYYDDLREMFQLMIKRVSRILRPEYGTTPSVTERRRIIADLNEEIESYQDSLRAFSEKNLIDVSNAVYDRQQQDVSDVKGGVSFKTRPDLSRGLFTKYHPIEKGLVVQMDALYATHIETLRSNLKDIVNRLGTIVEERSVAEGYFLAAVDRNQKNLNALSLTSVALAASLAKQAFYRRNKGLFRGYQWVSVLDSRTTAYCQERHLKVWYYDRPEESTLGSEEHPPGHFRCRSQTVPIFRGEQAVQSPSFEEWFERQPEATQLDILGPRRFELYRAGDIDISDVNTVRGKRRTLEELQKIK